MILEIDDLPKWYEFKEDDKIFKSIVTPTPKIIVISGNNLQMTPFLKQYDDVDTLRKGFFIGETIWYMGQPIKNFHFRIWEDIYEVVKDKKFILPQNYITGDGIVLNFKNDDRVEDKITDVNITHKVRRTQTITKNGLSVYFPTLWIRTEIDIPNPINKLESFEREKYENQNR